jgi:hypothetical protein
MQFRSSEERQLLDSGIAVSKWKYVASFVIPQMRTFAVEVNQRNFPFTFILLQPNLHIGSFEIRSSTLMLFLDVFFEIKCC